VIEDFRKSYGIDPRRLPEGPEGEVDERLVKHWATYVTRFMRELRQALNRKRPQAPRVEVLDNVYHDAASNRLGAMDLETWVREGLVDILNPYTGGHGEHLVDYDYFKKITRGSSCVFFEDITPRNMLGRRYAEHALRAYAGGAAGLAFWDTGGRIMRKNQWHTIRRLGHREDLQQMALQPERRNIHPIRLIDGWSVETRYM
jgi:hypothetical protein